MALTLPMIRVKPIFSFRFPADRNGLSKARVLPQVNELLIDSNICRPGLAACSVPNPDNAGLIPFGYALISPIRQGINVSKVFNSIVSSIAINVVDFIRPFPVGDKPSNSVGNPYLFSNFPLLVSIPIDAIKGWPSCVSSIEHSALLLRRPNAAFKHIGRSVIPRHISRVRVVCDKLLSNLLGYQASHLSADTQHYHIKRGI